MGNALDKITPHLWLGDKESIEAERSPNVKVIVTAITKDELERYRIAETVQERGPGRTVCLNGLNGSHKVFKD